MFKTRLATLSVAFSLLTACGGSSLQVKSKHVSNEKIDEIIANIENLYPDADKELKQHILEVAVKSIDDMVFIEGGSFMMGDFRTPCIYKSLDNLTWTQDAKCWSGANARTTGALNLHKVTLSSYSLSRYETTYYEFDAFRLINNLNVLDYEMRVVKYPSLYHSYDNDPTPIQKWQEAKNYCLWVAKLTDLPFDLPTEAQWEFAARNRGQKIYYATNDGFIRYQGGSLENEYGYHIDYKAEEINFDNDVREVGLLPPNPLGLYDMTGNASELVNDWFSKDYYKQSPELNPKGPDKGIKKVYRDVTGDRRFVTSRGVFEDNAEYYSTYGFRCSLQQESPIR